VGSWIMLGRSAAAVQGTSESELIEAARKKNEAAIRTIIRIHNRMLFRIARSILPSNDEAEDAVQAAYVSAFTKLESFRGESRLATWLGRIVLNEAVGRARRPWSAVSIETLQTSGDATVIPFPLAPPSLDPERKMAQTQIRHIVEQAIDELPEEFRMVLVARLVEEMSVADTASLLGLRPETVKTRLHRARAILRSALEKQFGDALCEAFPFAGERCQRTADRVLAALRQQT
jgi:RNA polymerase sigma-70 factor, ECF subfamily